MSNFEDRCAETVSLRNGEVSLRCDRHHTHLSADYDDRDQWHYDFTVDALWAHVQEVVDGKRYVCVAYALEDG